MGERPAARHLGIKRNGNFTRKYQSAKKRLAQRGFSPEHDMVRTVPDGYRVKGVSTYYNEEGKPVGQWVKSQVDPERLKEILQEVAEGFRDELPKAERVKKPTGTAKDLLNLFPLFDAHLGMLAWGEETGEDYDLEIAENLITGWMGAAVEMAPKANTAVLLLGGDLLHWDGLDAVTPTGNNLLDADTRFQKVVRVAIRVVRMIVRMLLETHNEVVIVVLEGNHDISGSVWLREWLSAFYEADSRLTVDVSPDVYSCIEWGDTSLFFHHGHKRKVANIGEVFASKFRDVFGRTKYSYGHVGHLHYQEVKESNLMIVEQHRTLAPKDAYASRGGWNSGRSATVITYSKRWGEAGRFMITPEML